MYSMPISWMALWWRNRHLCRYKFINIDHDGKPIKGKTVEYNDNFCEKGKKLEWDRTESESIKLRKYPVCEMNGYIYVWIHALPEYYDTPLYPMIDFKEVLQPLEYRARTVHHLGSHIQDIPENGADMNHFKFVHSDILSNSDLIAFLWKAKWKRGDDPDIK